METTRTAAACGERSSGPTRGATDKSHLHERDFLRCKNRDALARFARAVRPLEDRARPLHAMEPSRRPAKRIGGIRQRRRPRIEHGRRLLRQSAPTLCWRKRGAQSQCIGRSRGGLTSKIHALVDAVGKPVHLHLTAGNIHDVTEAEVLIEKAQGKNFIADKGYDADRVIEAIEQKKMIAVIPSKTNRKIQRQIDRDIYKERHWVENFFCRIKRYRRVATRYEKTAANFLGFVLFAAIRVWLA